MPDDVIRHISPQIWEHINLTGIYDWMREPLLSWPRKTGQVVNPSYSSHSWDSETGMV